MDTTELDQIREVLGACRDDPALFNDAVLGRALWSKQVAVCDAIARNPITVVPAGRAVGKSYLLAGIVLWWLYTREDSLVITTGPDHRQVVSVLWKEIRRALRPRFLDGRQLSPRVPLGYDHLTEGFSSPQRLALRAGSEWGALGFACKSDEGLSGQHAPDLLVIVDEASGVADPIWSAIHGLAATRLVAVGNPIKYDCHFRELAEKGEARAPGFATVPISSLEHPHAALEHSPVGAVCRSWLDQQAELHSRDGPWWRSNVLGLFPGQESVRFLPRAWLDACTRAEVLDDELWRDYPPGEPIMGIDVGGGVGADRSVVVVRDRKRLLDVFASSRHGVLDEAPERLEPVVVDLVRKWRVPAGRVVYDRGGIGRSFGSYLANHGVEDALGYFGAGRGGRYFVNRRTACAYALKKRLDPHREGHVPFYCGGLPEWPALRQELAELRAPTMEMEEGQVKQVLETKEDLMARLHRSPDLLDALLMTFTYSE